MIFFRKSSSCCLTNQSPACFVKFCVAKPSVGIGYHNLVVTAHVGTFDRSPYNDLPHQPSGILIHIDTIVIYRAIHNLTFLPFAPMVHSRQKKEGAIPCRVSGEAVGCPVRSTEEKAPIIRAHSPPRSGSYWSKLPTFHQSQNSAANAKSCVVWRILYHNSRRLWARI